MNAPYKDFSDRLIEIMKLRGYKASRSPHGICMRSLSGFTQASEQICRRYIRGEALPNYEKIINIAKELNVSPGWLLFGDETEKPKNRIIQEELLDYILKSTHPLFPNQSDDFADFVMGLLKDIKDIHTSDENIYKMIDLALGSIASYQKKQLQKASNT